MVIADRGDGVFTHGTTCAYCLWRFSRDPDEVVTVCPSCATPYHTECFDENGGCATFGCANWVNTQGPGVPGAVVAPPPQQQFQPPPATVTAAAQVPVVPVGQQPSPPAVRWNFCSQCGASLGANYGILHSVWPPDRDAGMNPRVRRLMADADAIRTEFAGHPYISVVAIGPEPAESYRVTFNVRGATLDTSGQPVISNSHRAVIQLPATYPREKPLAVSETLVFHPNFSGHAGAEIASVTSGHRRGA